MARSIRKAYVDVPGGQIHCRVSDGAAPAILFLHQTASSSATYEPLMRTLRLPNRLIALDMPGFGGSFDPPGRPSLGRYAGHVLAAADALDVAHMHLFGHHTGASLAIEIARRAPRLVRSIMLAGPVFMTDEERAAFARSHGDPIPLKADGSHLQVNWDYARGYNRDCDVRLLHREVLDMLRAHQGRAQAYSAVARHDTARTARGVRCPVLLLSSTDDYFYATLDRARALFPAAPVAMTGGGNFQPAADSSGTARAVERFLEGLAAQSGAEAGS